MSSQQYFALASGYKLPAVGLGTFTVRIYCLLRFLVKFEAHDKTLN